MTSKGSEEAEKLKTKFMSMWHSVKYSWALKSKTPFSRNSPAFLLGKCYHFKADEVDCAAEDLVMGNVEDFQQDFASRLWLTYREDFPQLPGSTLTSDCGWGCMLRAGQMMVAQGLVLHFLGRDWIWPEAPTLEPLDVESRTATAAKRLLASLQSTSRISESRLSLASQAQGLGSAEEADAHLKEMYHRNLVSWFADISSAPLGLHRLVHLGTMIGKRAGDWYGPAMVSHILKEAVKEAMEPGLKGITVYVSQDCTGIKDDAAVDGTENWAWRPSRLLFYSCRSAAMRFQLLKVGDLTLVYSPQQSHPFQIYNMPPQPPLNLNISADSCLSSQ